MKTKISITILDNKDNTNFTWSVSSEDFTSKAILNGMIEQINKAQIASMHVLNGYKIGRIRPTNKVVFQVQKFDYLWEDIAVSEQLAQLGNMRLMSRGKDGYKPNDFTKAIEWVLSTMDIEG